MRFIVWRRVRRHCRWRFLFGREVPHIIEQQQNEAAAKLLPLWLLLDSWTSRIKIPGGWMGEVEVETLNELTTITDFEFYTRWDTSKIFYSRSTFHSLSFLFILFDRMTGRFSFWSELRLKEIGGEFITVFVPESAERSWCSTLQGDLVENLLLNQKTWWA